MLCDMALTLSVFYGANRVVAIITGDNHHRIGIISCYNFSFCSTQRKRCRSDANGYLAHSSGFFCNHLRQYTSRVSADTNNNYTFLGIGRQKPLDGASILPNNQLHGRTLPVIRALLYKDEEFNKSASHTSQTVILAV